MSIDLDHVYKDSNGRAVRIIGLCGPKYCGKDTAASRLIQVNDDYEKLVFRRAPMAEGVKKICSEVFGWSWELLEDPVLKETKLDAWPHIEPRWPMMDIANWMRAKYGGDVWCRRWARIMHQLNHAWGAHVITDVRFPEEVDMISSYGGLLIYINRPEAEEALAKGKAAGSEMAKNQSESHYDFLRKQAHFEVNNTASVYYLQMQMMTCVRKHYDHWAYWPDLVERYALGGPNDESAPLAHPVRA